MSIIKLESSSELLQLLKKNKLTLETLKTPIVSENWKSFPEVGSYGEHSTFGEIYYTSEMYDQIYLNFKNNELGKELACNYNHDGRSTSIFWFHDLRKIKDKDGKTITLEYLPRYTPDGIRKIVAEELKYLSPEYSRNWEGKGAILFGAAATNEPFHVGEALMKLEDKKNIKKEAKNMEEKVKEKKQDEAEKIELTSLKEKIVELEAKIKTFEKEEKTDPGSQDDDKILTKGNEEILLLEKQNERIINLEAQLLKSELKGKKKEWMSNGIPKTAIDLAEKRILGCKNSIIKLDNSDRNAINLSEVYSEVFNAIPKILLKQQGDAFKLERGKEKTKTKEEADIEKFNAAFERIKGGKK